MNLKETLAFEHSFCVLPFVHTHITVEKKTKLCCRSDDVTEERHSEIKEQMLRNEPIPECNSCTSKECNKVISPRQLMNKKWWDAYSSNPNETVFYDLRYSNLCNLRCQTCNEVASSEWARFLGKDSKFFSWEPDIDINPNTKEIYLAGGEPFLIKKFSNVLNSIDNKDCEIVINTNATILTDHLMSALKPFNNVCFTLSIDGVGDIIEKIRTGCSWEGIQKNIQTLREELSPSFMVNTVVQKDNIDDIPNIAEWMDENEIAIWNTTILTSPEQYRYEHYRGNIDWSSLWDRTCYTSNIGVMSSLKKVHNDLINNIRI